MIALLQRVSEARVEVGDETVGEIGAGILMLVCAEPEDTSLTIERLLHKVLKLRVFNDEAGKMNRSLQDIGGGLLIVSQFTLAADTSSGTRPGFSAAAPPALARELFDALVSRAEQLHRSNLQTGQPLANPLVRSGRFATHMRVSLVNDGPVTIPMRVV